MVRRVLMLPGWNDSGPAHWQTRWPQLYSDQAQFQRVDQDDWHWPKRGDWMMNLDEALLTQADCNDAPVVLVAHSLGCHLVAAWAAHSQHTHRVSHAFLVAPPDLDGPANPTNQAPQLHGWRAVVRQRLPFAAVVVASRNDPCSGFERSQALAADWGASLEDVGLAGHVNAESGHGDWPEGWLALKRFW